MLVLLVKSRYNVDVMFVPLLDLLRGWLLYLGHLNGFPNNRVDVEVGIGENTISAPEKGSRDLELVQQQPVFKTEIGSLIHLVLVHNQDWADLVAGL